MTPIPIFMATDNNYTNLTMTAIISACKSTPRHIDFYIIHDNLSPENQEKIQSVVHQYNNANLEFIHQDIEETFDKFKLYEHVSITAFVRLLIPWLKPDINKAIWLDVDTICMDDISKLYDIDLGEFAVGAAKCIEIKRDIKFQKQMQKMLDLASNHTYFNSGVLLIDCKKWRDDKKLPSGFFEIENKYPNHICADQDILNKYFENNYLRLEQRFNVTSCNEQDFDTKSEYDSATKNMVIRHFIGKNKAHNSVSGPALLHTASYKKFWECTKETPFPTEFIINMIKDNTISTPYKRWIRLFGILPIIKLRYNKVYLLGLVPIITIK